MNIGNNLGAIDMCMHGVFLHVSRVCTVHTACSGPFNVLQGANAADVILGIKKQDRQESRSLMETYVLHMYGCVQLLASLFYFIMDCVSDPALEIQFRMVA